MVSAFDQGDGTHLTNEAHKKLFTRVANSNLITTLDTNNQPPMANAGSDQNLAAGITSTTLNGTASTDSDGSISSYA